jgi:pSer/pThr/pTyr-binding forkhead associated (FHA) protein
VEHAGFEVTKTMDVKLVVFKPNGARKDITLSPGRYLIGRQKDAQLRLPLPSVSRHHCEVVHEGEDLRVRDLGSSNGTFCNDERLEAERSLRAGDVLAVGPCRFTVQIDGEPALEAPAPAPPPPAPDLSETPPAPAAAPASAAMDDDDSDLDETVTKSTGLGSLLGDGITEESSVFDFDFDFEEDDNPQL